MSFVMRMLACAVLLVVAQGASAQNKCTAKGQMGGQPFNLTLCEVAYYQATTA